MALTEREERKLAELLAKTGKHELVARYVEGEAAMQTDPTPTQWFKNWVVKPNEKPPESGFGYVQTPYSNIYSKVWGVASNADMPRYRTMYRSVPIVKRAVDKTVLIAVSKGFDLKPRDDTPEAKRALEVVEEWWKTQKNSKELLGMVASDMLVYGNAFTELVYQGMEIEDKTSEDLVEIKTFAEGINPMEDSKETSTKNPGGKYRLVKPTGTPVWCKPLDPLTMRVRRDAYGNVFGFLQLLGVPPTAFTTENMAFFKYMPKSWQYESAYGTSMLMSVIRTQDMIWQLENDLLLISHGAAKIPVVVKGGSPERGFYSKKQLDALALELKGRGAGSDIFVRGDVAVDALPFPANSIQPLLNLLKYHHDQRVISLGVPPVLMGIPDGTTQTTAAVSFEDFVDNIRSLQETIADTIEEQVFVPVLKGSGVDPAFRPEIEWRAVGKRDETNMTNVIIGLKNSGLITPNEARALLRSVGLKLDEIEGGDELAQPGGAFGQDPEGGEGDSQTPRKPKDSPLGGTQSGDKAREASVTDNPPVSVTASKTTDQVRNARMRPYNHILQSAERALSDKIHRAYRTAIGEVEMIGSYIVDSHHTQAPIPIQDRLSKDTLGKMFEAAVKNLYIRNEVAAAVRAGKLLAQRHVPERRMPPLKAAAEDEHELDAEIAKYVNSTVDQITDTSKAVRDKVYEKLQEAVTAGWSGEKFSAELQEVFGFSKFKADLIADTELIRAYRGEYIDTVKDNAKDVGLKAEKFDWQISPDDLVCPECVQLNASNPHSEEEIADHNVDVHPSCRCWISARLE